MIKIWEDQIFPYGPWHGRADTPHNTSWYVESVCDKADVC